MFNPVVALAPFDLDLRPVAARDLVEHGVVDLLDLGAQDLALVVHQADGRGLAQQPPAHLVVVRLRDDARLVALIGEQLLLLLILDFL